MTQTLCSNKDAARKNFSRHARLYDKYADVQHFAAAELIKRAPERQFANILDIGCGTGGYTRILRQRFATAAIKALDISEEMIGAARRKAHDERIEFVAADAEEFDSGGGFDLVTSNAAFQWFDDLESSLVKYRKALTEGGVILFSTLGPLTLNELGRSLKEALGRDVEISSGRFLAKESLLFVMERHFRESAVEEVMIKKSYGSLVELLNHIKYTGTRGMGVGSPNLWNKRTLERIENAYRSVDGRIDASYQIFYCGGVK